MPHNPRLSQLNPTNEEYAGPWKILHLCFPVIQQFLFRPAKRRLQQSWRLTHWSLENKYFVQWWIVNEISILFIRWKRSWNKKVPKKLSFYRRNPKYPVFMYSIIMTTVSETIVFGERSDRPLVNLSITSISKSFSQTCLANMFYSLVYDVCIFRKSPCRRLGNMILPFDRLACPLESSSIFSKLTWYIFQTVQAS